MAGALLALALCCGVTDVAAQSRGAPGAACLAGGDGDGALSVSLISNAPAALCEPTVQLLEIRNEAEAALGDLRLEMTPPLGEERFSFEPFVGAVQGGGPVFFEMSADDGKSWAPVGLPLGSGDDDEPLFWSRREAAPLARLGPRGAQDDSILLRWRGRLGDAYGAAFAPEARFAFSAVGADACGVRAESGQELAVAPTLKPQLSAELEGRNVTRAGRFSTIVRAAPGDEIEWRVTLANSGEAAARIGRGALTREGEPIAGLRGLDGAPAEGAVAAAEPVAAGGRRSAFLRETVGRRCGVIETAAAPSWGCAPPPLGASARIESVFGGGALAQLVTAPDANAVDIALEMTGIGGEPRPGEQARVAITVSNAGAPLFAPRFLLALPDGYVLEPDGVIDARSDSGGVSGAEVTLEDRDPGRLALALRGGASGDGELGEGETLTVSLDVRRARARGARGADRLEGVLEFVDGCGRAYRTDPASAPAMSRQPALALSLRAANDADALDEGAGLDEALEPPRLVARGAETYQLVARARNTGEAAARRLELSLALGDGWADVPPPGCSSVVTSEGRATPRRYRCAPPGVAAPGESVTVPLALTPKPDAGAGASLSVRAEIDARPDASVAEALSAGRAARADAAPSLARSSAEATPLGFAISHRLLDAAGRPWEPGRAVDLGERVSLEVNAEWFGRDAVPVGNISVIQSLPPELEFVSAGRAGGQIAAREVSARRRFGSEGLSGQTLYWTLEPIDGAGRFVGRATLEAVEPIFAPGDRRDRSVGVIESNAFFDVDGRSYGVDLAGEGPTLAAPLDVAFRRPDLRLSFSFEREAGTAEGEDEVDGAALSPADVGVKRVIAGERLFATVTVENAGAAPGFFDWVELAAPPFVTVAPFADDGLDNDGDGRVDDPDEAASAVVDQNSETGPTVRWITLPSGLTGGDAVVPSGARHVWRVALEVAPSLRPGDQGLARLEGRFGAQPFALENRGGRSRVTAETRLEAEPIEGFLAAASSSLVGPADPDLLSGERTEHRLSFTMPPGSIENVTVTVVIPPLLTDVTPGLRRLGPGLECAVDGQPGLAALGPDAAPDAPRRLIWRLGRCQAQAEDGAAERRVILDFSATAQDVSAEQAAALRADADALNVSFDPAQVRLAPRVDGPADGRAGPRSAVMTATAVHGPSDARRTAPLGETEVRVTGPILSVVPAAPPQGAEQADAGDALSRRADITNLGDRAAEALTAYVARDGAAGLDCSQTRLETLGRPSAAAQLGADAACGAGAGLGGPPLRPGETAVVVISSRVGPDVSALGGVSAQVAVRAVTEGYTGDGSAGGAPIAQVAAAPLAIAPRAPSAPSLAVEPAAWTVRPHEGVTGPRPLVVGDRMRLSALFDLVEGRGQVTLKMRARLRRPSGAPIAEAADRAPVLEIRAARLTRTRGDMVASRNPGSINDAPVGEAVDVRPHMRSVLDPEGWTVLELPLGVARALQPSDGAGAAGYRLEVLAALADAPQTSAGRLVVAQPKLELREAPATGPADRAPEGAEAARDASPSQAVSASPPLAVSIAGPEVPAALVAEPYLELAALRDTLDGAVQPGDRVAFEALACNRGDAPAFAVSLVGAPPAGFAPDPAAAPTFLFADPNAPLVTRPYGSATRAGPRVFGRADGDAGPPVEPGDCVALRIPSVAVFGGAAAGAAGGADEEAATARFELLGYRGRSDVAAPGRLYLPGVSARLPIRVEDFAISAPERVELAEDDVSGFSFTVTGPETRGPAPLSLSLEGAAGIEWRIFEDANADGVRDGADTPWRDGGLIAPGAARRFIAEAPPMGALPDGWSAGLVVRALGVTAGGRSLRGAREVALVKSDPRSGAMRAERVMAIDRDCDGAVADERTQDAVFETVKEAAYGECVIMRIVFENTGAAAVERVQIDDRLPPGAVYADESARFMATPRGLVGGRISEPTAQDATVRFRFVGALPPNTQGAVEYRIRLTEPS